ncbi:hypothetical protein GCM10022286_18340 [Gryllotalpicola daejeonensis]|uniref:Phosphatidic acid phosphatase type 2/haloperoxidase domain-containing protein n=1 Tax=Gryllotalpicola daejeonensis TaxID=993087 RepID=A0ABP7ZK84_9MICO
MTRAAVRAGAFALAFLAVYAAAVLTPLGQQLDAASLGAFPWVPAWAHSAAGVLRVVLLATAGGVSILLLADLLLNRRFALAGRAFMTGLLAVGLAELLKQILLARPFFGRFGYESNTFPSGHVAFTAAVAAAAWGAAPRLRARPWRRRALVLLVVLAALAEPLSFAHRASDAVGGVLLAGVAAALCWPPSSGRTRRGAIALTSAAVVLVALAALVHAPVLLGPAIVLLLWLSAVRLIAAAGMPRSLGVPSDHIPSEKNSTQC